MHPGTQDSASSRTLPWQKMSLGFMWSRRRNRPVKKIFPSSAPTWDRTRYPGSVIERHNHEAKRSGKIRLVNFAPCVSTHILIICTLLCHTATLLHPTMKDLYQMFSTTCCIPRLFRDSVKSVAIAAPLSSDCSHPGTKWSRRRNRPVKKIFPSSVPTRDWTRYPWICNLAS